MKNIFTKITISLILISILSSCKEEYHEYDTSDTVISSNIPTESTTGNPYDKAPNHNTEVVKGIEVVPYPNPKSVYMYDKLTEDQKIAYDAIADLAAMVIETGGQKRLEYPLPRSVDCIDMILARNLYISNFKSQMSIVNGYISESLNNDKRTVYSLYFAKGGAFDIKFKNYTDVIEAADSILASLEHDGTEYGKAFAIAKWFVDNIEYDHNYLDINNDNLCYDAYGALIAHKAVCDGYASAYDLLCKRVGLETIYITGETTEGRHAWNMICIDNKWYHIDTTWMTSNSYYSNFMVPDEMCFKNGHISAEYLSNENFYEFSYVPSATSYNPRFSYSVCEDAISYFRQLDISKEGALYVHFDNEEEDKRFLKDFSGKVVTDINGISYAVSMVKISEFNAYRITFLKLD